MVGVSSMRSFHILRLLKGLATHSEHTPALQRLFLAQAATHPLGESSGRLVRAVFVSRQRAYTHWDLYTPLRMHYKTSWAHRAKRRCLLSGHARGLRLGLDRARGISTPLSGFTPTPTLQRW